jgi:MFS family permease
MTDSAEASSAPYPLMEDDGPATVSAPPPEGPAGEQARSPEILGGNEVTVASPPDPQEAEIDYYGLALVFLAPALGGFLYGYDIGATSFVLAMMRSSRDPDTWWHDFPMMKQGLLVSALSLGALLGSHIVLVYLAKSIGRRKEIRVSAALYIVGAMLNVMSGTIFANTQAGPFGLGIGIVTLVVGRMTYGAGVGFIMHGAPTYMAEMSPSAVRGAIVSAKETVIVFGIVVGMMMGDLMSDYPDNWKGK